MKKVISFITLTAILTVMFIPNSAKAIDVDTPYTPLQSGCYSATGSSSISCHSASSSTRCMDTSTILYVSANYCYAKDALISSSAQMVYQSDTKTTYTDATVSFSNGYYDQSVNLSGSHSFTHGSSYASGTTFVHYGN